MLLVFNDVFYVLQSRSTDECYWLTRMHTNSEGDEYMRKEQYGCCYCLKGLPKRNIWFCLFKPLNQNGGGYTGITMISVRPAKKHVRKNGLKFSVFRTDLDMYTFIFGFSYLFAIIFKVVCLMALVYPRISREVFG